MKAKFLITVAAIFFFGLSGGAAFAQGNSHGNGNGNGKGHDKNKHGDDDSYEVYNAHERDEMNDWYHQHENHLPPGLAKRDSLPPGLEKQLRERGTLPPGLQKKIEPVPESLEVRLPPPPADCGCRHVIIGGHVVLLNVKTNYVYSVFHFEIQ